MPELVDKEGRKVRLADREEANQRFLSGDLLLEGGPVPVLNKSTGEVGTVPADQAEAALRSGQYALSDREELETWKIKQEAADSPVRAGLEGVARGVLPFGIADTLQQDVALFTGGVAGNERFRREAEARREENPIASTVGEVAGTIGTMVATGGAAASLKAETAIASKLGGGLLARTAGRAATGAVEGAVFGASQGAADSVIENKALTAESILSYAGEGLLWGSAGAAGIGLAGEALGKGAAMGRRGLQGMSAKSKAVVRDMLEKRTGRPVSEGAMELLGDAYANASGVVSGADKKTIREFTSLGPAGKALREKVTKAPQLIDDTVRRGRAILDEGATATREVLDESVGAYKVANVKAKTAGKDLVPALEDAVERVRFIQAQADEMLTDAATWGERAGVKQISDAAQTLRGRMDDIAKKGGPDATAELFVELDNFKRIVGKRSKAGRFAVDSKDSSAIARIRGWYEDQLRPHLELEELYGGAATMQRETNAAWTEYLGAQDFHRKSFLTKIDKDGFNPIYTHDPAKLQGFVTNLGTASNEAREEALEKYIKAQRRIADAMEANMDLSDAGRLAAKGAREGADRLESFLRKAREDVADVNRYREMEQIARESASAFGGAMIGGGLAAAVGPEALAVGALFGGMARPDKVVRSLAAMERIAGNATAKVRSASKAIVGRAKGYAPQARTAVRAARPVAAAEVYQRTVKRLMESGSSQAPQGDLVDVSGEVSEMLTQRRQLAIGFLRSKLPRGLPGGAFGHLQKPTIHPLDAEVFARYVDAVERPRSVIDDLRDGVATPEAIEAIRTVYPELYGQLRAQVQEALLELSAAPPYASQVELALLFGIAADPSLEPAFIARMQSVSQEPEEAPAQGPSRPAPPSKAPDLSGGSETAMQTLVTRER